MDRKLLIPLLNKHSINEENIINICQRILNNHLIIKFNYIPENLTDNTEELIYSENDFNWELNLGSHTNMAMLHLHSLEPVSYLLLAYDVSSEKKYLYKAYEILFAWYSHSSKNKHFYMWYRHCTADRAVIISQLYILRTEIELTPNQNYFLSKLIFDHKNFLSQEENFILHNHGVLMDIGLISLSLISGDEISFDFSLKRLQKNFTETFTDNMICVENSISYSIYNIEQFIKCQKYLLDSVNKIITERFDEKINLALDFLQLIKQPDNQFPHFGDGEKIDVDYLKTLNIYKYFDKHSLFDKEISESIFKVYPKEGYAVAKHEDSYLFLTAGDLKKNHKHADDLSFVLSYGEEVFIDSGIFSYSDDELRKYQISASAHNSIVLNNETYNYITNDENSIQIKFNKEFDDYYYIVMKNSSYSYANILRHIYILKEGFSIIIFDEVDVNSSTLASQYFNLSPDMSEKISIDLKNNLIILDERIKIQNQIDSYVELYNGKNPYNVNALYSEKFHELQPILKFSINKYSVQPRLITLISQNLDLNYTFDYDFKNTNNIDLFVNDKLVHLEKKEFSFEKIDKPYLNIRRELNTIEGQTIANYFENQEYSWDIMKGTIKEANLWYQKSNEFQYTFDSPGIYTIRCYIRDSSNIENKFSFISKQKLVIE